MSIDLRPIHTFGIVGAGTLGWRIGLQAAISGYEVLMLDLSEEVLAKAVTFQGKLLESLIKREAYGSLDLVAVKSRIATTTDAHRFTNTVDFVSESVTEDLVLKQKVWAQLAGCWRPGTVLTTNTSYLLPSSMAGQSGDPARFCAFHFHDVFDARVVDVMPHPGTDPSLVPWLMELGRRLHQIPVHVERETPGYLFNHMLMAYIGAAGQLLAKGKGSVEAIDRSWMGNMGSPVGPFGMLDQIGLDTVMHILAVRTDSASKAFLEVVEPLVTAGRLGVKTRGGFYDYPHPDYKRVDFLA